MSLKNLDNGFIVAGVMALLTGLLMFLIAICEGLPHVAFVFGGGTFLGGIFLIVFGRSLKGI